MNPNLTSRSHVQSSINKLKIPVSFFLEHYLDSVQEKN